MELTILKTQPRPKLGSAESRRVRRSGQVPAVVYGLGRDPHACSVDYHVFDHEFHEGNKTFKLEIAGKTEAALLKDVQWDTFGKEMIHVDFVRIDLTARVRVSVPLAFSGHPEMVAGSVLDHVSEDVFVECLPTEIPKTITVNLEGLKIGEHVDAKDLKLPAGVSLSDDPKKTLASYHYRHVEAEAPAGTPADAAAAEPVVLKEKKPEEGAADAKAEKDKK